MISNLQKLKDDWFTINEPVGKGFGYPDCCIKEFCAQPPELLKYLERTKKGPTKDDLRRYHAGCINGVFTGFVPCVSHAKEILSGRITIASLITETRDRGHGIFPRHQL